MNACRGLQDASVAKDDFKIIQAGSREYALAISAHEAHVVDNGNYREHFVSTLQLYIIAWRGCQDASVSKGHFKIIQAGSREYALAISMWWITAITVSIL